MPFVSSRQIAKLIDVVSNLPPDRIADVEAALSDARRRAEASTEVDGRSTQAGLSALWWR